MDKPRIVKYIGVATLLIGVLLLGRVLSGGNPDTGKFSSPAIMIMLGFIALFSKPKVK